MCGFVGWFGAPPPAPDTTLQAMTACLAHRGPDDEGYATFADGTLGFGFRRLAIIDRSPSGAQPMTSRSRQLSIVFNGEIYNFRNLRRCLEREGSVFRGSSDTEVLLEGMDRWGVQETLDRADGMFALALWDHRRQQLTLARDRVGEKPLFYGRCGQVLLFASELKALEHHPDFAGSLDYHSVQLFLRWGYVPSPRSIYSDVRKVPPGTSITFTAPDQIANPQAYWSLTDTAGLLDVAPFAGGPSAAVEELDSLLLRTVADRMIADVPLGAFLSGGIDSSLIVAMMQRASEQPVRTFSIGFTEKAYDEAPYARAVARHLGTDHTEHYVTPSDALELIPQLPHVYDEPFADSSQIPTLLVAELARREVTVALSGDGGDELFGGYDRYSVTERLAGPLQRTPAVLRRAAAQAIRRQPPDVWQRRIERLTSLANRRQPLRIGNRLHKLAQALEQSDVLDLYESTVTFWGGAPQTWLDALNDAHPFAQFSLPTDQRAVPLFIDALTYLPDDILVKVDRASMSHSLEVRVPFLAREVVEFAWTLPIHIRRHRRIGKWPLREVLDRYVPREIFERPKQGFGVPIGAWLRGPLRPWASELLEGPELEALAGPVTPLIRQRWREHLAGTHDHEYDLWTALSLGAWTQAHHHPGAVQCQVSPSQ